MAFFIKNTNNQKKLLFLVVLPLSVFVVLTLSAVATWHYQNLESASTNNSIEEQYEVEFISSAEFPELTGEISLTLAAASGDRHGRDFADTDEYILNLSNNELAKSIPEDDWIKISSDTSADGRMIAYFSSPYKFDIPDNYFFPTDTISQLFLFDTVTREKRRLTDNDSVGKREPEWSPDGKRIAYYEANSPDAYFADGRLLNPVDWNIIITDTQGNTQIIGPGMQPFWSPNGKSLLYLSDQGLIVHNLADKSQEIVFDFNDQDIELWNKMAISNDGSLLAFSNPSGNNVIVYEILQWDPFFSIQIKEVIPIEGYSAAYWPTFSPDNSFLLYQWSDYRPDINQFIGSQLRVYDFASKNTKTVYDLSDFRFDASWVNSWVFK